MNIQKLIEVVAYILARNDNQMDYYNLIKECYIVDRKSIQKTGYAITGDSYVSMNRGPVLRNLYALIKNKSSLPEEQALWNKYFVVDDAHKIKLQTPVTKHFLLSRSDENLLNEVCQQFYKYTYSQMKEYSHQEGVFPEWKPVGKGEEEPIPIETIMKTLGFCDKDIQIIIEEQKAFEQEKKVLCNLN
ncbi:MAG: SocA family protein [Bacteroidales bacterium]|nr:SocA family protein [Bacteroidales bacterium]